MPVVINRTKTLRLFSEMIEAEKRGEVSARAVERAREWLQEGATDGPWWYECIYDEWTEGLAQIGFMDADINFSGFYSQGDGASFTANIDCERLLDFLFAEVEPKNCITGDPEDFRPWIVHKIGGTPTPWDYRRLKRLGGYLGGRIYRTSSHYVHENTCRTEIEFHGNGNRYHGHPKVKQLVGLFEDQAEELRKDLCHAIYDSLEKEYEYCQEDENLIENSLANEYYFDEEGERDDPTEEEKDAMEAMVA
jgi:hypothetical protein